MNTITINTLKHQNITREQLRELARKLGIRRGRNTTDTLQNLLQAIGDGRRTILRARGWRGLGESTSQQ